MSFRHVAVWLDHREARIFHVLAETFSKTTIDAPQRHVGPPLTPPVSTGVGRCAARRRRPRTAGWRGRGSGVDDLVDGWADATADTDTTTVSANRMERRMWAECYAE